MNALKTQEILQLDFGLVTQGVGKKQLNDQSIENLCYRDVRQKT
jgi:hypothetical protein